MKKIMITAAAAGLGLVAAAPPSHLRHSAVQDEGAGRGYPPCSRTVTDRCIQLYERGVATRTNLALNERLGMDNRVTAMGGPYEPAAPRARGNGDWSRPAADDYPPCSRTVTDRCTQTYERRLRSRYR